MPKVADGIHLQVDLSLAQAQNMEVELYGHIHKQPGIFRLLGYVNHANMGIYSVAIDNYLNGQTSTPLITAHPLQTTIKYGLGMNFQQNLTEWLGLFGRWGWNEGKHESYAYTEVDQTWQIGVLGMGARWGRKDDRTGLVFVSNGISRDHAQYLALGGYGFLLGDGKLTYGRENILEGFYTFHAWRGFFPAVGLQYVVHPGYNQVRGPVLVPTLRIHLEF
jgi:high affinity Mn2+ porin